MSLPVLTFTFWNYYVLKLLRLETITFSDATLSDINIMLCYVLLQYPGGWLLLEDCFGPWRSMFVCFLMLSSSFLQCISVSVVSRPVNTVNWHENNPPILMAHRCALRQQKWWTEHEKKSWKNNLNIIGGSCLVSIAYWRKGTQVRQ